MLSEHHLSQMAGNKMKEMERKAGEREEGRGEMQEVERKEEGRETSIRNIFCTLKAKYEMKTTPLQQKHDSSSWSLLLSVPREATRCCLQRCPVLN